MIATTTIQKWGNSRGIRLPKQIPEEADMISKDAEPITVEISVVDGTLKITRAEHRKMRNIPELFEGWSGEYQPTEIDWGAPIGREIW